MLPIHRLLSRIRWDPRFRTGRFEMGYYDRRENRIRVVPLERIRISDTRPMMFELYDDSGELHRIPLHRVRRVWRNGRLIWERRPAHERAQDGESR